MTLTDPSTSPRHATVPADLTVLGTVLTVWAHPDDETYLAAGLLAALRDAGQRVVCVTATRGEAADPDADRDQRAALAEVRTEELAGALALLGVGEHRWLDLPDGGCADLDPEGPVSTLAALIEEVRPDTVVTFGPDGFTGHADHRTVGAWVDLALARGTCAPLLLHPVHQEGSLDPELDVALGVFVEGAPRSCLPDEVAVRIPLDGDALDRKVAALLHQRSQTAGIVAAVGRARFAGWVARETFAEPALRG